MVANTTAETVPYSANFNGITPVAAAVAAGIVTITQTGTWQINVVVGLSETSHTFGSSAQIGAGW